MAPILPDSLTPGQSPSDILERYLDAVCRSTAVRLRLRLHLHKLTAWEREQDATLSEADAQARVLKHFGRPVKNQIILEQLEELTASFLTTVDWFGRPLLRSESRDLRWIMMEWETPGIKAAILVLPGAKKDHYHDMMGELREVFHPGPAEVLRLQRLKPEAVAEMHPGNFATVAPPFQGASIRRLSTREAAERVFLIGKLANHIAVIISELALVANRDRPEAARIAKTARRLIKLGRAFGVRQTPVVIPAAKSLDELMAEMKKMGELLAKSAPEEPKHGKKKKRPPA